MGAPRTEPRGLGTLLGALVACLATLPVSSACPRPCACPGPAELHCTFRYLSAVPPRIPPGAQRINLGYNSLRKLSPTDFAGLEKLELLLLHSNEISTIPEKVFSDLRSLQVLKMSYNKVRVLQQDVFYGLSSLVRLHMDHNQIEFVNPYVFYGLTSLRLVHLDGNLLQQLHPDTFVTLRYSQLFRISFLKHISLSDNVLTSLPQEMFSYMPELESIYLHGNPWSCDCSLQGFAEWAQDRPDVIKCRKERSSGVQQCPVCASPRNHNGKSLADLPSASFTCTKPVIHDSLKSRNLTMPDDGDFSFVSPKDLIAPIGSVVLNLTDQAGNRGDLVCDVQKPKETSPISFDKSSTVLETSFSAFLVCAIDFEHIQQLWSILALYSNSPLELEQTAPAADVPFMSYKYRQVSGAKDELFTGVEAVLRAEPAWLLQRRVALQLDRAGSTLSALRLRLCARARLRLPGQNQSQSQSQSQGHGWAIIPRDSSTQTERTVLLGGSLELRCRADGRPAPALQWALPDGSRLRAPHMSADGRLAVLRSGLLALRSADVFDSGLYHCIGTNQQDADVLTFRVTVLEPRVQRGAVNGARLAAAPGSTVHLPCPAAAAPEPALTWVLPGRSVLRHSAGNKRVLANGTLRIQGLTERDAGYYRCVAANRYGADLLVFQVLVGQRGTALSERQGALGEWEEGSGNDLLLSAAAQEHPLHPSGTAATLPAPGGSAAAQGHPLQPSGTAATPAAPGGSAAAAASSQGTRSAHQRNSHGKMPHWPHRDRAGRRFRGHRRQFVSSARRADPQRWAALLEKTKRNLTRTDKRGEVATEPPMQVQELSEVPEDEEETSGDLISPEEGFMIAATERSPVPALGTATELLVTAGPEGTASATPAWSSSLLPTEPSPLPSPPPHPMAPATKRPQALPKPTDSWERPDLSQILSNGVKQSAVPSGTSTLFPAGQKSIYSGESNKQHLRSASMTPTTEATGTSKALTPQNTDKLHILHVDNVSTKTDHQVSVATVNAPSSELGPIYFHSTQKGGTPNPPLASTLAAHQQIWVFQDVPTHPPQLQQHPGRRRKISGQRRIVRPGRVPSRKEHRYDFGRPGSARGGTAVATGVQLNMNSVSHVPALNHFSSSMEPEAPQCSPSTMDLALGHPVGTRQSTALLREEDKEHSARQKAAATVTSVPAKDTASTAARGLAAMGLGPTVTPATAPQTDTRATKRKILRAGGRRAQRRKRPPKTAAPQRVTAAHSSAGSRATPAGSRATPAGSTGTPAGSTGTPAGSTDTPAGSRATPAGSRATPAGSTGTLEGSTGTTAGSTDTPAGSTATPAASTDTPAGSTGTPAASTDTTAGSTGTTAPHSTATIPAGSRATPAAPSSAATPAVAALMSPAVPPSPAPAEPLPGSTSAGSMTKAAALGVPPSPETAQHGPRAAMQPPAASLPGSVTAQSPPVAPQSAPGTQRDTQLATSPAASPAQSPPVAPQTSPWPEQPPGASSATSQHSRGAARAAGAGAAQEQRGAEPPAPAGAGAGPGAPAAATAPSARHPSPLPAPTAATPGAPQPPPRGGQRQPQPGPPPEGTERGSSLRSAHPTAPWGRDSDSDSDSSAPAWAERPRAQGTSTIPSPTTSGSASTNHFSKPRIVGGELAAYTLLANSDAFIPCEATGNPPPTIQWTKIPSGRGAAGASWAVLPNGTLAIGRAGPQHAGRYLCTAANALGTARLAVTLAVLASPPRIAGGRRRLLTAHSGTSVALPCRAQGWPPPSVSWLLANGTHLSHVSQPPGPGRARVQPDGTLLLRAVTVYDRGLYTCLAANPAGSDALALRLQVVAAPPSILEEKRQSVAGALGQSLSLPCTAQGTPEPAVHWVLPDGTALKPLQLERPQLEPLQLEPLQEKPLQLERPQLEPLQLEPLQLEPLQLESPQVKPPQLAPPQPWHARRLVLPNGTLQLASLAPWDSGTYECIATSSTGSDRRVVIVQLQRTDTLPRIATASQQLTRLSFGDRLLLNCTASGEPKPRIIWRLPSKAVVDQWHRMGSRIHVYPNGSLAIEAVTEKDAGDYLCVARNRIGDDLILMKVSITMKPAKIDPKQQFKKLVPYGKGFRVDCKASGSPTPEISWGLPDGTLVNHAMVADGSGHRARSFVLFDNGTLYLNRAGVAEGGDYTCYAQNTLGRDEMKVHVTVVVAAPQIKHNHETQVSVAAGDTALLDCEAAAEPRAQIFWLLPSSQMISSSRGRHSLHANGSLSIGQAGLLDAGQYLCVARNPGGDDTRLYTLQVAAKPPVINGVHGNKTVMRLTAVRHSKKHIDCRAEGTPPPQVTWVMPDNILLPAPYYGSRVVVHENGTLEIRNIRPSDTADFICVARNAGGESVLVVQLEVTEMLRRPIFRNPFNEKIIAKPGEAITLNCSVDGNPAPDISWMLPNGTWLSSSSSSSTAQFVPGSGGTLTIPSAESRHAGRYRCAARNQVGYIEKLLVLEVARRPSILSPAGLVRAVSGEPLALPCRAEGSPRPRVAWTLPGGRVLERPQASGRLLLLDNGTLLIRAASAQDAGTYLCRASNAAGHASLSVPVLVAAHPPRIVGRAPPALRAPPGAALQLHCAALGVPKPDITWHLPDGSLLSTARPGRGSGAALLHPTGTLLLQSPGPGLYRCTARNSLGSDTALTRLSVL